MLLMFLKKAFLPLFFLPFCLLPFFTSSNLNLLPLFIFYFINLIGLFTKKKKKKKNIISVHFCLSLLFSNHIVSSFPLLLFAYFQLHSLHLFIFEPPRDKTNKMACAPSEDSDQPGHPPSLISLRCVLNG